MSVPRVEIKPASLQSQLITVSLVFICDTSSLLLLRLRLILLACWLSWTGLLHVNPNYPFLMLHMALMVKRSGGDQGFPVWVIVRVRRCSCLARRFIPLLSRLSALPPLRSIPPCCSAVISAARISFLSKPHIMNWAVRFMGSLTTPLLAHIGFICLFFLGRVEASNGDYCGGDHRVAGDGSCRCIDHPKILLPSQVSKLN